MNVQELAAQMDGMVEKGAIVEAVDQFFHDNATTSDYGGTTTNGKAKMVEKMQGFLGGISNVNGITLHHTIASKNASASEFTFNFDMKDGSKIFWHEIIRRDWQDGKVIREEYFDAQS